MAIETWRDRVSAVVGVVSSVVCLSVPAVAQVIPDETLGNERSTIRADTINNIPSDVIEGGAQRGQNLFHSFQRFDVQTGRGAYFANPADVNNIFSRVTGGIPSNIDGVLGVLGNANLFFMNPSGIVFGENASLNVNGSFVGTTANAIQFGEQGFFSATNPELPSQLLTIDPSAFLFNQIVTQPTNSIASRATLSVPEGQSLLFIGGRVSPDAISTGNIFINEGRLRAPGGRIELGGLAAPGAIGLNTAGSEWSLTFPTDVPRIDVSLIGEFAGFAELDVTSGGGGSIAINAHNINIFDGTDICAGIGAASNCGGLAENFGAQGSQSGDITLNAQETVTIAGSGSTVENNVNSDSVGNSGNININAESVFLSNGGALSTTVFGQGNSGRVRINATGDVVVEDGENNSFIRSDVGTNASGTSGGIEIAANSLHVLNGAQIFSNVRGQGNSGQVTVSVGALVSLEDINGFLSGLFSNVLGRGQGSSGGINITANALQMISDASMQTSIDSDASGNSGGINITANTVQISSGAQIQSSVYGRGNSGAVRITARDLVSIDGEGKDNIFTAINTRVGEGATEIAEGLPSSTGGIYINTGSLSLTNRAQLGSSTRGIGNSGDIVIEAQDRVFMQNTTVITEVTEQSGIGDAGDIRITTGTLELQGGSWILADTEYKGDAGDIIINARDAVIIAGIGPGALDDENSPSQITSTVNFVQDGEGALPGESIGEGNAGSITINTGTLSISDDGFIRTRTEGLSNAEDITISVRDWIQVDSGEISSSVTQSAIGNGGNIEITAGSLSLSNGAELVANTGGEGDAGNITLQADEMQFTGDSGIFTNVRSNATGNAGITRITADTLSFDNASITANTSGRGDGGDLYINADTLQLTNTSVINSGVRPGGVGNGGDIEIQSRSISLDHGSQIGSFVYRPGTNAEGNTIAGGQGRGGDLRITATDSIALAGTDENGLSSGFFTLTERNALGEAGNITIDTGNLRIADGAAIVASTYSDYRGGNILVNADALDAINGGQIVSATRSNGNAGAIQVNVTGDLTLSGVDPNFADRQERARQYIPESDGRFVEISDIILNEGAASGIFGNTTPGSTGVGGTIALSADRLNLKDGAAIFAATSGSGSAGSITISNSNTVSLENAAISTEISPGAVLNNPTANQGNIDIQTRSLDLANSDITASTSGQGNAGRINIQSTDRILLDRSTVSTAVNTLGTIGNGGNINIETALLNLSNQSEISSSTSGQGNAGRIRIHNADRIRLNNSAISTAINPGATATQPSNITLQTRSLTLNNGANITASTNSQGDAGNIRIRGAALDLFADRVSLSDSVIATDVQQNGIGQGGNIRIRSNRLNLRNQSRISAQTSGQGEAGSIDILAAIVSLSEGSRLRTNTTSNQDAGSITLQRAQQINLRGQRSGIFANTGFTSTGEGGSIDLNTADLVISNGAAISVQSRGSGDAGNLYMNASESFRLEDGQILSSAVQGRGGSIRVNSETFYLNDRASIAAEAQGAKRAGNIHIASEEMQLHDRSRITAQSQGEGTAGNINIRVEADFLADNSNITTNASESAGGAIELMASQVQLRGNSDIRTEVASGVGGGGNITVNAAAILAFDDSDIDASATGGRGGNITFDTPAFFGTGYEPDNQSRETDNNDRVDVNATGAEPGNITTPDTSFIQNSLADLPETAIDTEALIASSCVIRRDEQGGTFIISGIEGLPTRPGNTTQSHFPTGEVRSISDGSVNSEANWQIGDSIVEPQGVYQLPDGRLILSRECSN